MEFLETKELQYLLTLFAEIKKIVVLGKFENLG